MGILRWKWGFWGAKRGFWVSPGPNGGLDFAQPRGCCHRIRSFQDHLHAILQLSGPKNPQFSPKNDPKWSNLGLGPQKPLQNHPKMAQTPQNGPKIAQNGSKSPPKMPEIPPKCLKSPPKCPKSPKLPQIPPKLDPKSPPPNPP